MALPKKISWIILALLIFCDGFLTHRAGMEGNPLWRPLIEKFGIDFLCVLGICALVFFFVLAKIFGWLIEKFEHFSKGEDVILTNLVIAFSAYDFYITFLVQRFGYLGSRSHYPVMFFIAIPVLIYNLWLEKRKRKEKII